MNIGEIFIDLHGNQYEIKDYHILGPDYPLFNDNRDAILSGNIDNGSSLSNLIIRGNDQMIIYNYHYRVYWMYDITFIQHFDKYDIRKGFYNETDKKNTKGNRVNCNDGRLPQSSKSRSKRK